MMVVRDYAKSLKRQNVVLGIVLVLSVALIIFLGETGWLDSRDWTRAAEGTQKLLFVWQGWMIWRIVRNRRLLREPDEMKQYMVEKNDERRAAAGALDVLFAQPRRMRQRAQHTGSDHMHLHRSALPGYCGAEMIY